MRYSRHKRSGISYGCHNESPGLLLAAVSDLASLQVIPSVGFTVAAVCIGDLDILLAAISDLASLQVIPSVGFTVAAVCIGDLESA